MTPGEITGKAKGQARGTLRIGPFLNQDEIEESRRGRRRCTLTYSEEHPDEDDNDIA